MVLGTFLSFYQIYIMNYMKSINIAQHIFTWGKRSFFVSVTRPSVVLVSCSFSFNKSPDRLTMLKKCALLSIWFSKSVLISRIDKVLIRMIFAWLDGWEKD